MREVVAGGTVRRVGRWEEDGWEWAVRVRSKSAPSGGGARSYSCLSFQNWSFHGTSTPWNDQFWKLKHRAVEEADERGRRSLDGNGVGGVWAGRWGRVWREVVSRRV